MLSGYNTGRIIEKRALERSIGYSEARFLRSAAETAQNAGVFLRFFALQATTKCV